MKFKTPNLFSFFKFSSIPFLITALLFFSGFNTKGIFYDLKSYNVYKPASVHGGPETIPPAQEIQDTESASLEFFALGCTGSGNEGQRLAAQSMAAFAQKRKPAFVLYLGDNFYGRGVDSITDPKWKTMFEDIYSPAELPMPFYAVLGNHDHYKNPDAQIEYSAENFRWRMPDRYYYFERVLEDGTKVEFFAIDTNSILKGEKLSLQWLDEQLGKSSADWKIVYGHHPLYSQAITYKKQREKTRQILEPVFIRHRVDAYVSAHNHSIEVLKEKSGVQYIVSGAGSRPRDVNWTDETKFARADVGFVWMRLSRGTLETGVIGKEGKLLFHDKISKKKAEETV